MKIQDKALSIGKYGCLAFCYLYCLGIEGDDMLRQVARAMDKGFIASDCTVLDAGAFLEYFSGRKFNVEKKAINSIKEIKNPTPVRYDNGASSHWVVVENGKIVFNSLEESFCVMNGKPSTARIITMR